MRSFLKTQHHNSDYLITIKYTNSSLSASAGWVVPRVAQLVVEIKREMSEKKSYFDIPLMDVPLLTSIY